MSIVTVLGSMGTGGRVPGRGNAMYGFGGIPPSLKEKKLKEAKLQNALAKAQATAASAAAAAASAANNNPTTTSTTSSANTPTTTTSPTTTTEPKKVEDAK
ncbi:leucine-rich repeat-containing protein 63-like [Macrobrachium rosenbergii]|uniref:leucine-rich repeat-containing protein 63-like n=1 Tax=Macrobrachium rosenbergii TaxID=79674 RepID=UPI0034D76897